jgi:DNA-binding LytR/AlgR family response regulator
MLTNLLQATSGLQVQNTNINSKGITDFCISNAFFPRKRENKMNYSIAICDDNTADLEYVSTLVDEWSRNSQNIVNINIFPSAEAFLFNYEDDKDYDILLLDIEMGNMNGIELAKKVREENRSVQIVFITGFPDFIAEGYEVSALHYLIKPVSTDKLSAVLDRAVTNLGKSEKSVIFTVNGEALRVSVGDIISVEAFAHSCAVTTVRKKFEVRSSMSDIEKLLDDSFNHGFIRCHRSYIVGIRYIKSISKTDITLDNEEKIPLSRSNYNAVNQAFICYFRGE